MKIFVLWFVIIIYRFSSASDVTSYNKWVLFEIGGINSTKARNGFIEHIEQLENVKLIETMKESAQIGVGPLMDRSKLKLLLENFNLKSKHLHGDIGRLVENSHRKSKRSIRDEHFDSYMNYKQMENFFSLLERFYPKAIRREVVGKSFEGRNISLFIVSTTESPSNLADCQQPSGESDKAPVTSVNSNRLDKRQHLHRGIDDYRIERRQLEKKRRQQRLLQGLQRPQRRQHLRRQRRQDAASFNQTHDSIYISPEFLKTLNWKSKGNVVKKKTFKKPIIFIDAGLHSREWVSPAAALYLIKKLVENPSLTSRIDWFIMPMVNPDGYIFSWQKDRFWRKSRSKSGSSGCFGADLNRNFDIRWGEVDTSRNPCSEHYGGTRPNSEVETVVIKQVLTKEKSRLKAYISLHNWGQDILYPYIHSREVIPSREQQLEKVSKGMAEAIKKSQGKTYRRGRGSILLYPASGTSIDWAYDVMGVPYSYLIELRDKLGLLGFLLPEGLIKPTGEDVFAAMKHLASELQKETDPCI